MFYRLLDFLFDLHNVHFGAGTRFSFVIGSPALIILGGLILGAIGYVCYFPQAASPNKKIALGIFRGLLLFVLFLMCFRPRLVMEHQDHIRSVVAIWVDNSASMALEDPYNNEPAMRDMLTKISTDLKTGTTTQAKTQTRPNRYQLATAVLTDATWLKDLNDSQDIAFFTGSSHAQPLGTAHTPEQIDAILANLKKQEPTGESTDVPGVAREIMETIQGQRLGALILLTDGQTTEKGGGGAASVGAGRSDQALKIALDNKIKISAIPAGQQNEPFDLKLSTPNVPPSTFIKDPVSVRIHVTATGLSHDTNARVSIYRKAGAGNSGAAATTGTPLATKDITFKPEPPKQSADMDIEVPLKLEKTDPGKSERFDLVAKIEPTDNALEELNIANNISSAVSVTVLDAQINVLYVEGYPRWEYRYLKNELIREPTVNVSTYLLSADDGFVQDADPIVRDKQTGEELFPGPIAHFPDNPKDLAMYDVIIIGDVEPTFFSPTQQRLMIDWVRNRGGGLMFIAGSLYNPESYRGTPLEVLLPITPDEIDPRARVMAPSNNLPFTPVLTAPGRDTNLFRFFDDPDKSWSQVKDLPYMYWYKPVQSLRPGAIVLATLPPNAPNDPSQRFPTMGGEPLPLLVSRQFGAGPVIFSAYCDSWRWRQYTGEPLFQSYWLQLCRQLYKNKALGQSKRLELTVENAHVEIGRPLKVTLTVKDPTLAGQLPAEIPVTLIDSNGQTVETITLTHPTASPIVPANASSELEKLEGTATATRLGEFTLAVPKGTLPIDLATADLIVEPPQAERETVTTDIPALRLLTEKTHGILALPPQARDVVQAVPDRSLPILQIQSEELWTKPIALILAVLLASTEWWIRKSAGLI